MLLERDPKRISHFGASGGRNVDGPITETRDLEAVLAGKAVFDQPVLDSATPR